MLKAFYPKLCVILIPFLCSCNGEESETSALGNNPLASPSPSATPIEDPDGGGDNPNPKIKIAESQSGIQTDFRETENLAILTVQGNAFQATGVRSTDGSMEISVSGGASPK